MLTKQTNAPKSWLAFELNILRRLQFKTAILPLAGEPQLGVYLKRWNVRVLANDAARWAHVRGLAEIQNNAEQLSEEDLAIILEDAYVPGYKLQNPALRNWFNETDAWWFDNVRKNIEKLPSQTHQAIALSIGMQTGDYVLSFTEETRELRQPLSNVYKRLAGIFPKPINNGQNNSCANKTINSFLAEKYGDLMFLRLPPPHNSSLRSAMGNAAWREEWVQTNDEFWSRSETEQTGKLGAHVETKFQYLRLLEETLKTASHIQNWVIAHTEDGFITTQDIAEIIGQTRRVDTVFTKDFSELTGTKAVILTA